MAVDFTFVDLFAGIGGFKMALGANGGRCVAFSEINNDAIDTYCKNYNVSKDLNFGDLTKIDSLPPHDILTAGVPCQSWSIAGKNLGFDDDRGQLWNDTIYLLNKHRPKAFIFENVKGLVDPRNSKALNYILARIRDAGYVADYFVINSHDYGVPQNRVRVYIIGFLNKFDFKKFKLPKPLKEKKILADVLGLAVSPKDTAEKAAVDLFGNSIKAKQMSLSAKNGLNDYFLFNDLRNGHSTIHSWDITDTTERQKDICLLLLKNRRKSKYGPLDGNPLSLAQLQSLDPTIVKSELDDLISLGILKEINYRFKIRAKKQSGINEKEAEILQCVEDKHLVINDLKRVRNLKIKRVPIAETLQSLKKKQIIQCVEKRVDFKNTKISSGINGINRIFMPTSDLFPTLVASDTNDYVATKCVESNNPHDYKQQFLDQIYYTDNYRKITKQEACEIQGFPKDFILPESRARWMKLIGNSVSVPVIDFLIKAIISTGALNQTLQNSEVA